MAPTGNRAFRRKHPNNLARSYRDFYYETKMGWKPQDRSRTLFRRRAHARDYIEGLHWCLNYYHRGCQSWDWYFPHLYSPLATDLVNLSEFYEEVDEEGFCSMKFDLGEPFPSLAQLLSVLPPQSSTLLPKPFAELMVHPSSPIIKYYPPDFTSDPNGKRESWEAIVQIPFIEADVLLGTVEQILNADSEKQNLLSTAERRRNIRGQTRVITAPGGGDREANGSTPRRQTAAVAREVVGSTKGKGPAKPRRQPRKD
jgi:5'-3' exoribonuclease 1